MIVYTDANPTQYAIVTEDGRTIVAEHEYPQTSNTAEYRAIIAALNKFDKFNEITEIRTDSELVVKQLNHEYSIKNKRLRDLATIVWSLTFYRNVKFVWVPREENLAGKALG